MSSKSVQIKCDGVTKEYKLDSIGIVGVTGGSTQTDRVTLTDIATGNTYKVYVEDGKLTMEKVQSEV